MRPRARSAKSTIRADRGPISLSPPPHPTQASEQGGAKRGQVRWAKMKEDEGKCGKCGQPTHLRHHRLQVGGLRAFPAFPLFFFHHRHAGASRGFCSHRHLFRTHRPHYHRRRCRRSRCCSWHCLLPHRTLCRIALSAHRTPRTSTAQSLCAPLLPPRARSPFQHRYLLPRSCNARRRFGCASCRSSAPT